MTLPAFIFGIFVAILMGGIFHFWRGGNLGRLLLYIILSIVGFWIGHIVAAVFGWSLVDVGPLHLGMGVFGSLVTLGFGYWLSLIQVEKTNP